MWQHVHIALLAVGFVAALAVWIWSLCTIRKNSDPVRKPFGEAGGTAFILSVSIFIALLTSILAITGTLDRTSSWQHLINLAILWSNLADATMFGALAFLSISILRLQAPSTPLSHLNLRKYITWAYWAVTIILAVACFGLQVSILMRWRDLQRNLEWRRIGDEEEQGDWQRRTEDVFEDSWVSARLHLSLHVLILLGNLGLLIESVRVMVQIPTSRAVSTAAKYFLAILTLWLIRTLFRVITTAKYSAFDWNSWAKVGYPPVYYEYALIPVFENWPFGAALGLFIALGAKTHGGVWSNDVDELVRPDGSPQAQKDNHHNPHVVPV